MTQYSNKFILFAILEWMDVAATQKESRISVSHYKLSINSFSDETAFKL